MFLAKSCEVKEDFPNSTHHSRSSLPQKLLLTQRCQRGVPRPLLFVPASRKSRGISPTTAQSPPRNRREIAEDRKNRWQSKGIANVSCSLREVNLCSLRMSEVYEIHMSGIWLLTVLAAVYLSWKIHTYKKTTYLIYLGILFQKSFIVSTITSTFKIMITTLIQIAMLVWGCWSLPAKASPPDDHLPTRTAPIDCNLWWFMVVPRAGIFTKTTAPHIKSSNDSWFTPSKWNLLWVKSLKFNSRSVVCFVVGS